MPTAEVVGEDDHEAGDRGDQCETDVIDSVAELGAGGGELPPGFPAALHRVAGEGQQGRKQALDGRGDGTAECSRALVPGTTTVITGEALPPTLAPLPVPGPAAWTQVTTPSASPLTQRRSSTRPVEQLPVIQAERDCVLIRALRPKGSHGCPILLLTTIVYNKIPG